MTSRSRGVKTEKGESPSLFASPTFVSLLLSVRHSAMTLVRRLLSLLTDFQVVDQAGRAQLGGGQNNQWFSAGDLLRRDLAQITLAAQRHIVDLPAMLGKVADRLCFQGAGIGFAGQQAIAYRLQGGVQARRFGALGRLQESVAR